jgi:hypothetical protein
LRVTLAVINYYDAPHNRDSDGDDLRMRVTGSQPLWLGRRRSGQFARAKPPRRIKEPLPVFEVEIEGMGVLSNPVQDG